MPFSRGSQQTGWLDASSPSPSGGQLEHTSGQASRHFAPSAALLRLLLCPGDGKRSEDGVEQHLDGAAAHHARLARVVVGHVAEDDARRADARTSGAEATTRASAAPPPIVP